MYPYNAHYAYLIINIEETNKGIKVKALLRKQISVASYFY
jgi:hypothetical protein